LAIGVDGRGMSSTMTTPSQAWTKNCCSFRDDTIELRDDSTSLPTDATLLRCVGLSVSSFLRLRRDVVVVAAVVVDGKTTLAGQLMKSYHLIWHLGYCEVLAFPD
jgi:hypothetical protein